MTMEGGLSCHTNLQKSTRVLGRGPKTWHVLPNTHLYGLSQLAQLASQLHKKDIEIMCIDILIAVISEKAFKGMKEITLNEAEGSL